MIQLANELKNKKSVAIAGHIRPDGDCIGSCIGLYLYIKENFPQLEELKVYLEEFPECFYCLEGTQEVTHSCEAEKEYDLFIALDAGDTGRLGDAVKYLNTAKDSICIDHHISNKGYAARNYIVPTASSTSELIYGILDSQKVTKEIAAALYLGIAHDTGVFHYSCTSSETMRIAGKLLETGIAFSELLDRTFYEKTYLQNQIMGRTLLESMLLLEGQCIVSALKQKEMQFYNVNPLDLDGIASQLRNTKGVEVAIFLYETATQEFKVSMRSGGSVDVGKVAVYFGGGGHICASGCSMQGSFHDVVNNLTYHIEKQLLQQEME